VEYICLETTIHSYCHDVAYNHQAITTNHDHSLIVTVLLSEYSMYVFTI